MRKRDFDQKLVLCPCQHLARRARVAIGIDAAVVKSADQQFSLAHRLPDANHAAPAIQKQLLDLSVTRGNEIGGRGKILRRRCLASLDHLHGGHGAVEIDRDPRKPLRGDQHAIFKLPRVQIGDIAARIKAAGTQLGTDFGVGHALVSSNANIPNKASRKDHQGNGKKTAEEQSRAGAVAPQKKRKPFPR